MGLTPRSAWFKCFILSSLLGTSAYSGTITFATVDQDLGSGWRTSSVAKSDIDGNNVLGSDGWFVAGDAGSQQLPDYITSFTTDPNVYGGNSNYSIIDDPTTTPGVSPTTIESGTLNPFPGPGSTNTDATFTFGGSIPSTVRVGLMIDNLDIAAFNPSALQIVQESGPGASAVVDTTGGPFNNGVPDWVYFDIQAQPGETYDVVVTGGPNGCACLGAVSFDSVAPEPSSLMLGGFGAVLLLATGLRRRYCAK